MTSLRLLTLSRPHIFHIPHPKKHPHMEKALAFGNSNAIGDFEGLPHHLGSGSLPALQRNVLKAGGSRHKSKRPSEHEMARHQKKLDELRSSLEAVAEAVILGSDFRQAITCVNRDVVALSTYKHSEQARLSDFIFRRIDIEFKEVHQEKLVERLQEPFNTRFFIEEYNSWDEKLIHLLKLFVYLDRVYLFQHPKKKTIREHGLRLITELFHNDQGMRFPVISQIVSKLHLRIIYPKAGEETPTYEELGQFVEFLQQLHFDKQKSAPIDLLQLFVSNYMACREDWWEDSKTYVAVVFDNLRNDIRFLKLLERNDIAASLARRVLDGIIIPELSEVLAACMPYLFEANKAEDIGILTKFLHAEQVSLLVDYVKQVLYHFGNYISTKTKELLDASSKLGTNPLTEIVAARGRYMGLCQNLRYYPADEFDFEVRTAMSNVLSLPKYQSFCVQTFSKYCDAFFKLKDSDFNSFHTNLLIFFKLVQNKSRFISTYERDLSKRLLLGKSFNFPLEFKTVDALLSEVGESLDGSNLRAMIDDVKKCDLNFRSTVDDIEFFPLVLKKSNWPEIPKPATELKVPPYLEKLLSNFTDQFRASTSKGKYQNLDWSNYLLHQLTLLVSFDKGSKDVQVNLLQAIVILVFSEHESISFDELQGELGLEEKLLRRVIASLSSQRYPLLRKEKDVYQFNYAYWDKSSKIRPVMAREKDNVVEQALKKADQQNRDDEVKAAIVRILKGSGTMLYPELMGQVLMQLKARGDVLITDIKKKVEGLITNEYIKRSEDGQTLNYIP